MSRNVDRAATTRGRRKGKRTPLLWIGLIAVVVIALLLLEQIALLYVLATLSIIGLLAVVARADLRGARQATVQIPPGDDSAAIGDRTPKTNAAFGAAARLFFVFEVAPAVLL